MEANGSIDDDKEPTDTTSLLGAADTKAVHLELQPAAGSATAGVLGSGSGSGRNSPNNGAHANGSPNR